jgi:hypothetical protein
MDRFLDAQFDKASASTKQEVPVVQFKIVPTFAMRENKSRMINVQLFDFLLTMK